jgi:ABC-2 type transport system ATP-binding protein
VLHELTPQLASLEEAYMELTAGSVEYAMPGHPDGPATVPAPTASAAEGSN